MKLPRPRVRIPALDTNAAITLVVCALIVASVVCGPMSGAASRWIDARNNARTARETQALDVANDLHAVRVGGLTALITTGALGVSVVLLTGSAAVSVYALRYARNVTRVGRGVSVIETPTGAFVLDGSTMQQQALGVTNPATLEQGRALAAIESARGSARGRWLAGAAGMLAVVASNRERVLPEVRAELERWEAI